VCAGVVDGAVDDWGGAGVAVGVVGAGVVGGAVFGGAVVGGAVAGGAVVGGSVVVVSGGGGTDATPSAKTACTVAASTTPVAGTPIEPWNALTAAMVAAE